MEENKKKAKYGRGAIFRSNRIKIYQGSRTADESMIRKREIKQEHRR